MLSLSAPVRYVVTDTRGRHFFGVTRRRAVRRAELAQDTMPRTAPSMLVGEAFIVASLALRAQAGDTLTPSERAALDAGAPAALVWVNMIYQQFK